MRETAKILIVEDDAVLCRFLDSLLSRAGYEVLTAMNGPQGLAMAVQEEVSLVLTDLYLPGIHGLDLLERLRAVRPGVAAIVISGSALPGQITRVPDVGAVGFLTTPFGSIHDVLDLVARSLALPQEELGWL